MPPQSLGFFVIGVRALAAREKATLAEEAFAAGDSEGHDHPVADFQCLVLATDFDHFTHGLMAKDVALLHAWNDAVEDMQVGAANSAGSNLDDRITRMLDLGVRHGVAPHVPFAVIGERLHQSLRYPSRLNGRIVRAFLKQKFTAPAAGPQRRAAACFAALQSPSRKHT